MAGQSKLRNQAPVHSVETRSEAFERLRQEALMRPRPPTWGRRPRTYHHRPHIRAANPPGSAILWPFARFPRRDIPPFLEQLGIHEAERTGLPEVDVLLDTVVLIYRRIQAFRQKIYERKAVIPHDDIAFSLGTSKMWEKVDNQMEQVEKLRGAIVAAGFEAPAVPEHFFVRF